MPDARIINLSTSSVCNLLDEDYSVIELVEKKRLEVQRKEAIPPIFCASCCAYTVEKQGDNCSSCKEKELNVKKRTLNNIYFPIVIIWGSVMLGVVGVLLFVAFYKGRI